MKKQTKDIRWQQRLVHFTKAIVRLEDYVSQKKLNRREREGLVKAFEYTFELAWNTIKDYYENQGGVEIQGSRDAFRLAFRRGLIANGERWMKMIEDRNLTSHVYDEDVAIAIANRVIKIYFPLYIALQLKLEDLKDDSGTTEHS